MNTIKGDWLDANYVIKDYGPRSITVEVVDGENNKLLMDGLECWAEQWRDGTYITNGVWNFSPDAGELERCGIVPEIKSSRGGARPNSGPKTVDGARGMTKHSVSLDAETIEKARYLGDGDLSAGLRKAVRLAPELKPGWG